MSKDKKERRRLRQKEKNARLLERLGCMEKDANADDAVDINAKDRRNISFSFLFLDKNKYRISEWSIQEIEFLLNKLGQYSQYIWNNFRINRNHFDYVANDGLPSLPQYVPQDIKLAEIKIDNKKRVVGFIDEQGVFNIIWFDRNHEVCK